MPRPYTDTELLDLQARQGWTLSPAIGGWEAQANHGDYVIVEGAGATPRGALLAAAMKLDEDASALVHLGMDVTDGGED